MRARNSISLQFRAEAYDYPDGYVDAGTVMDWLDKTGYAAAATWARATVLTNYVGNMRFKHSVPVETTVLVQARLIYTGRHSVHVQTRLVLPESVDDSGEPIVSTECVMVYVAVDQSGQKQKVRQWEPSTEKAKKRQQIAQHRVKEHEASEKTLAAVEFPDVAETTAEVLTLRFVANSADTYLGEMIQGGTVMRWLDEAADVCAARWSLKHVVAVFAGGVRFYNSVYAGDLVEVEARLVHTSARSMHVVVRAWSGSRRSQELNTVARGVSVMVSAGKEGRAQEVPQWVPSTEDERELEQACVDLVNMRNRLDYDWSLHTTAQR